MTDQRGRTSCISEDRPAPQHPMVKPYPSDSGRIERAAWWIDTTITMLMGLFLVGSLFLLFWIGRKLKARMRVVGP